MKQTANQFNGLVTDNHALNTKNTTLTDAINAGLITKGEDQLILQNLKGFEWATFLTKGYTPLGLAVYNNIIYILSGKFTSTGKFLLGEIGTYPSPNWDVLYNQTNIDPEYFLPLVDKYQPLHNFSTSTVPQELSDDTYHREPFRTSKLNFQPGRLIEVELQPSYDGSVNIVFTDFHNPIRLVNSRFRVDPSGKKAAIADRRQVKDTNTYSEERFNLTRLIRQSNKIADLSFEGVAKGGILKGGLYHFYFKYMDADGALTDLVEQSSAVTIAHDEYGARFDEPTDQLVKFKISNVDQGFSAVKVYYSLSSGDDTEAEFLYEINNIYDIHGEEVEITIYGTEDITPFSEDQLNLDYTIMGNVRTITQADDMLVMGNITVPDEDYEHMRQVAARLEIYEEYEPMVLRKSGKGYADPNNVYHKLGYWAGETYELAIVGILKDGRGLTPAFPVRGGDNYNGDLVYTNTLPAAFEDSGFINNDNTATPSSENILGIYRTHKCREGLLYNEDGLTHPNNDAETTNVKYLTVDVTPFKDDQVVQDLTDGFFFVRRNRSRDCIAQGYLTKGGSLHASYRDPKDKQNSIIPQPMGYVEFPGPFSDTSTTIPTVRAEIKETLRLNNEPKYFALYSPDFLTDPLGFASLFDGERKGLMMDHTAAEVYDGGSVGGTQQKIRFKVKTGNWHGSGAWTFLADKKLGNKTSSLYIISEYHPDDPLAENYPDTPYAYWNQVEGYPNDIEGSLQIRFWETRGTKDHSAQATMNFRLTEDLSGHYYGTCYIVPTVFFNQNGMVNSNNKTLPADLAVDQSGNWIINVDFEGLEFETSMVNQAGGVIVVGDDKERESYHTATEEEVTVYKTSDAPRNLLMRDLNFCPESPSLKENSDEYRKNTLRYMGGAIEGINKHTWVNIIRNKLYTKFEDYVGVTFDEPDYALYELFEVLTAPGQVEKVYTNYGSNSAKEKFSHKISEEGLVLGLLTNIYNNPSGAMDLPEWKLKYTVDGELPYYPVTKRYRWNEVQDKVDIYRGDCFLSYIYKRNAIGLGIEGIATATDPNAYLDDMEGFGLRERGIAFPLVAECNTNAALRTKEVVDETEKLLYGQHRSFWPQYESYDVYRHTRQPESRGYNFGYHQILGRRVYNTTDNRAPSLNAAYSNRIMVSPPSVGNLFHNGFNDISGFNFRDYNKQLGPITSLITHDNNVYCIFESGVGIVPMNQRTMMSQETGGVFIDDAEVLAKKMTIVSSEYGSTQQFSVIKSDKCVYGVDINKNKIWRVVGAGNGRFKLELISDFAIQKILNNFKDRLVNNQHNILVKANYDGITNNVYFSYYNEINGQFTTDYFEPTTGGPIIGEEANQPAIRSSGDEMENRIGTVYWNETHNRWISRLKWNPLWMAESKGELYSFSGTRIKEFLWRHFSKKVPHCHFYGRQENFEFEFVLVDNSSAQKMLHNLVVISNRAFPGRVTYRLLENDFDFELELDPTGVSNNHVDLLKQRHETVHTTFLDDLTTNEWHVTDVGVIGTSSVFTLEADNGDPISQHEAERLVGGFVIYDGLYYIIGPVIDNSGVFYNEIRDENNMNIPGGVPAGWTFDRIDFGIMRQNMEYVEDHLYIEVGKGDHKSDIRDKAIKIRFTYEGYDYVAIQAVLSKFTYSLI